MPAEGAGADATAGLLHDGDGQALPASLRDRFETSLGVDLGGVRVHTDGAAADAAAGHGARAFAVGDDVHFGAGEYKPDDPFGQHLIAHEVAHTVQQRGGAGAGVQAKLAVSSSTDASEHEADRAADAMVSGAPASVSGAPVAIARAPKAAYDEKATFNGPNWGATIDWDDPPQLYAIAGTGSSLRAMYQAHLKKLLAKEPLMVELGALAMGPIQIGQRIERIADKSEPLKVGTVEKSGKTAAEPYRAALWRCSQRAIVETLDTEGSNGRYKKTKDTYCNVYSADMVIAMGGYLPRVWYAEDLKSKNKVDAKTLEKNQKVQLSANEIGLWLRKYGADFGWRVTDNTQEAQDAANGGRVVIIQASKADGVSSGHVNVILAEGSGHTSTAVKGELQPLQSQAGEGNYKYSDAVPTGQKENSESWWKGPAMQKEKDGNCWIYEGAHQDKGVGSALATGGKFGK